MVSMGPQIEHTENRCRSYGVWAFYVPGHEPWKPRMRWQVEFGISAIDLRPPCSLSFPYPEVNSSVREDGAIQYGTNVIDPDPYPASDHLRRLNRIVGGYGSYFIDDDGVVWVYGYPLYPGLSAFGVAELSFSNRLNASGRCIVTTSDEVECSFVSIYEDSGNRPLWRA